MAKKPAFLEAKFEQVLSYFDRPQLVLLSAVADSKIVGIAVTDEKYIYPFFAAQVSSSQFSDYLAERFDLRYLLMKPDLRRNFIFDLATMKDGIVALARIKLTRSNAEYLLPDHGLFARDHTEKLSATVSVAQSEQTFGVDGSWDLPEFSRFYANITDLYAFFNSVDMFLDRQYAIDKKDEIQRAFTKPFEGGGSYVSMFGSLALAQVRENRLHVGGIQYNSPGFVRIKGFEKPFTEIRGLLDNLSSNIDAINIAFNELRGFLAKAKMLRMSAERFDPGAPIAGEVEALARKLAVVLDIVDFDALVLMASGNMLVVAKVLLSIQRRATRLYQFFLEGRASFDVPVDVPVIER